MTSFAVAAESVTTTSAVATPVSPSVTEALPTESVGVATGGLLGFVEGTCVPVCSHDANRSHSVASQNSANF